MACIVQHSQGAQSDCERNQKGNLIRSASVSNEHASIQLPLLVHPMKSHPLHNDYYHFNTVSIRFTRIHVCHYLSPSTLHSARPFVTFSYFSFFLSIVKIHRTERFVDFLNKLACRTPDGPKNIIENENSVPRPPATPFKIIILIQIYILINFPLTRSIHFAPFVLRTLPPDEWKLMRVCIY